MTTKTKPAATFVLTSSETMDALIKHTESLASKFDALSRFERYRARPELCFAIHLEGLLTVQAFESYAEMKAVFQHLDPSTNTVGYIVLNAVCEKSHYAAAATFLRGRKWQRLIRSMITLEFNPAWMRNAA
ncbi:hypothetical protein [Rhizobium pisi]|uniref:hypothetical protein n=1 Tax=Rhizobium pisi TaxID=574561 RepID=UPI003D06D4EE